MAYRKVRPNGVTDEEAWNVVLENQGLVHKVIKSRFRWLMDLRTILDYDDLVQMGNLGLFRAVKLFNPNLGFALSTYAYNWITQFIYRGFWGEGFRTVRYPAHIQEKFSSIRKKYGSNINLQSIYDKGEITDEMLKLLRRVEQSNCEIRFDKPITREDSDDINLLDYIMFEEGCDPDDSLNLIDLKAITTIMLSRLTDREKELIEKRFGLNGNTEKTLRQAGKFLGVTPERARQIQNVALDKIRNYFNQNTILFEEYREL